MSKQSAFAAEVLRNFNRLNQVPLAYGDRGIQRRLTMAIIRAKLDGFYPSGKS